MAAPRDTAATTVNIRSHIRRVAGLVVPMGPNGLFENRTIMARR